MLIIGYDQIFVSTMLSQCNEPIVLPHGGAFGVTVELTRHLNAGDYMETFMACGVTAGVAGSVSTGETALDHRLPRTKDRKSKWPMNDKRF